MGTVAIVTGAASGIGEATAREFARRGAIVVAVDRNAERLAVVAQDLVDTSPTSCFEVIDVTSRTEVEKAVATVTHTFGRVDIVFNNAGIPLHKHVIDTTPEEIEKVFAVNFFGAMYFTSAVLPGMLERKRGSIINVTSVAGYIPNPREAAYGATKAALSMWSHGLQNELYGTGVHVGVISPGPTATEIWRTFESPASYSGKLYPPSVVARAAVKMVERNIGHMTAPRQYGLLGAMYPIFGRQMRWGLRRFDKDAQSRLKR
ncbi:MAG: SDR family oxidoreductase [Actinobacteria bacterium]|nr:SDR family oxidoreductase [Actinomycetota bacterium]